MTPADTIKREQAAAVRRALEDRLALHLRANQVQHTREFTLPGRNFRWDFAFQDHKLLVEVHGGIWRTKGAHNTGSAITRDAEKGAYAAGQGWRSFAVTGEHIASGKAVEWIKTALGAAMGAACACVCPRCAGPMRPGIAMGQTYSGNPDFPGGEVVTVSPGGPGRIIACMKCAACGHSETPNRPSQPEQPQHRVAPRCQARMPRTPR